MRPNDSRRRWTVGLFSLAVLAAAATTFGVATVSTPTPAWAQEEPAADGGEAKGGESLLMFTFNSLGIRYVIPFTIMSFSLVALIVMNLLGLRRDSICPQHLVQGFDQFVQEKRYQEAYDMAKTDDSFLGQMLAAGLAKLSTGFPQALEAMQEVGEEESMKLEHRISYISLIGAISTMTGLLGTVDGMTAAFRQIAQSGTSPKPQLLANNICTALVTTVVGLVLAIPAIIAFNFLKNLMARRMHEIGKHSGDLMSRFESVGLKK